MRPTIFAPRVLAVTAAAALALFTPAASSAQSTLDAGQAQVFLGNWVVSMDTDFGPLALDLAITDQGGKVAAQVAAAEGNVGRLDHRRPETEYFAHKAL